MIAVADSLGTLCLWGNRNPHFTKIKCPTQRGVFYYGGSGWIRTSSVIRQQIYSLPRLSNSGARPILFCHFHGLPYEVPWTKYGAGSGNRTRISSLEGLHTSLCTMPATNSKPTDYIPIFKQIK